MSATAIALAVLANPAEYASAHPGGLDKQGCHNDRKNGGYHCHRSNSASRKPGPAPARTRSGDSYYANCDAVRAAGKDPIYRGQPGYRPGLDRDGDGIACEKTRFNR